MLSHIAEALAPRLSSRAARSAAETSRRRKSRSPVTACTIAPDLAALGKEPRIENAGEPGRAARPPKVKPSDDHDDGPGPGELHRDVGVGPRAADRSSMFLGNARQVRSTPFSVFKIFERVRRTSTRYSWNRPLRFVSSGTDRAASAQSPRSSPARRAARLLAARAASTCSSRIFEALLRRQWSRGDPEPSICGLNRNTAPESPARHESETSA